MRYDAIIIGSGQAGVPLAGALAGRGWQVALVERGPLGGTCINTGCSPTKTIIASARAAHLARRGADFGVQTGPVSVDFARVMARKDEIVRRFRSGVEKRLQDNANVTIVRAEGHFEGPHRVRAGNHVLEAERIYINTGARAAAPPVPGLEEVPYLTNTTILDLTALPDHLVIIGGGYIGLEYAQAFRRFGSEVTIVERGPQIMGREDRDIADEALKILGGEGIRVLLGAETQRVARRANGIEITVRHDGASETIAGRTCWSRRGGGPTRTGSTWRPPGSPPTRSAPSRWTITCRRMCRASGRWATSMDAAPSRTPRTTISRSS